MTLGTEERGRPARPLFIGRMRNVTAETKHIIEDFESLPDPQKREVLAELIRISRHLDYPAVSDDELVVAADAVFLEYDRRESGLVSS
jgi:hypothetical protein